MWFIVGIAITEANALLIVSDFSGGIGDGEIEEACLLVCHFSLSKGELTYIDT